MSYESYYQRGTSVQRLFNDHRFKLYYALFVVLLLVSAVGAQLVGFPTIAGMLVSYVVLFSVVSALFVFLPVAILSKLV
ncbi:hypothetical protein ACFQMA_14430 [Halosimplex aquaticum]|uniref:Uncharacterized protein n=1 Tax=Halosimplex aquaticum TaxID=3026162 RepID=A0ABD5Y0U7_9EURY|nr:hypothetical protein [Halosimplex aquaticum]